MIRSFKCKETEGIWDGRLGGKFPREIQEPWSSSFITLIRERS
jgi:hypothetical protein